MRAWMISLLVLPLLFLSLTVSADVSDISERWYYGTEESIEDIAVQEDGSRYAVVTNGTVYVFGTEGNQPLWFYDLEGTEQGIGWNRVAMSDNGMFVAVASRNYGFYVFDGSNGDLLTTHVVNRSFTSVSMSSDGLQIAAGCMDGKVYFFDAYLGLTWAYEAPSPVTAELSPSGEYAAIASLSGDNHLSLITVSNEFLWSFEPGGQVIDMAFSEDDTLAVAVGDVDSVHLFLPDSNVPIFSSSIPQPRDVSICNSAVAVAGGQTKVFSISGTTIMDAGQASQNITISDDGNIVAYSDEYDCVVNVLDGDEYSFEGSGVVKISGNGVTIAASNTEGVLLITIYSTNSGSDPSVDHTPTILGFGVLVLLIVVAVVGVLLFKEVAKNKKRDDGRDERVEVAPMDDERPKKKKKVTVECPECGHLIPLRSNKRPLDIKCPECGVEGVVE